MKNLLLHSPVETSDHLITHHDTAVAQQLQVHLQTEGGTAEIKPLNQREDQGKDGGVQEKETPPGVQEEQTPQGLRWWRKENPGHLLAQEVEVHQTVELSPRVADSCLEDSWES